jgi:DnaJ-class molecular chaperone
MMDAACTKESTLSGNLAVCPACDGTGQIVTDRTAYGVLVIIVARDCSYCDGLGLVESAPLDPFVAADST